jgi:signal transduction histidine kinase
MVAFAITDDPRILSAIKFSPSESSIHFTLSYEPDAVTFQVQDRGIGIPAKDLAHIYELFVRGENAKGITGTGLGLAVVKRCLDLHGGKIFINSQLDVGTTFTVKIPQSVKWERQAVQSQG